MIGNPRTEPMWHWKLNGSRSANAQTAPASEHTVNDWNSEVPPHPQQRLLANLPHGPRPAKLHEDPSPPPPQSSVNRPIVPGPDAPSRPVKREGSGRARRDIVEEALGIHPYDCTVRNAQPLTWWDCVQVRGQIHRPSSPGKLK